MLTAGMKIKDNSLYIGNYKARDLAFEYQTPLMVFDEKELRKRCALFKDNFKSSFYACKIVYASKAFLSFYILDIIKDYDFLIDAVSPGELFQIISGGFSGQKIVLHGNNKKESFLRTALDYDIPYIVADSEEEVDRLILLAKHDAKILLRINPGIAAKTNKYIHTANTADKFGESIYDTDKIMRIIAKCQGTAVHLAGFHAHIGSNITDSESYRILTEKMLAFTYDISKRCNVKLSVLNLGGGFGIKYREEDPEINIPETLKMITGIVDDFTTSHDFGLEELMIEPGRCIAGPSASTLYTVGSVKKTHSGKKYVFVDGGMTDNIRPALYHAKYSVALTCKMNDAPKHLYDIAGPCCEMGDIVALGCHLPEAEAGDVLISYCTGAYCYAMSSNYNGFLRGAVIAVCDDKVKTIIKAEDNYVLIEKEGERNLGRIFDCHSDMLFDLYCKAGQGIKNRFLAYHVPQLKNSVIKGSIFTMYSPYEFDLLEACKIALKELDLKALPCFKVVLGLEGLRNLKKTEDIDILYAMGFRHAMLTWNEENKYAAGAKANPLHGLKEEGRRLLLKMQDLGMIIDLAHLNEKSFYDALKVVDKNIIYSHGNCKALCNHPRNVTDMQMRELKKKDGLLGLTLANNFVAEDSKEQTLAMFFKHMKHAISIMGTDNVCLGFDFMDYLDDFVNCNLTEVNNASLAYRIIAGMEEFLTKEEINKICYDNFYNRYHDKIYQGGKDE